MGRRTRPAGRCWLVGFFFGTRRRRVCAPRAPHPAAGRGRALRSRGGGGPLTPGGTHQGVLGAVDDCIGGKTGTAGGVRGGRSGARAGRTEGAAGKGISVALTLVKVVGGCGVAAGWRRGGGGGCERMRPIGGGARRRGRRGAAGAAPPRAPAAPAAAAVRCGSNALCSSRDHAAAGAGGPPLRAVHLPRQRDRRSLRSCTPESDSVGSSEARATPRKAAAASSASRAARDAIAVCRGSDLRLKKRVCTVCGGAGALPRRVSGCWEGRQHPDRRA
jgi:hypothetical protein